MSGGDRRVGTGVEQFGDLLAVASSCGAVKSRSAEPVNLIDSVGDRSASAVCVELDTWRYDRRSLDDLEFDRLPKAKGESQPIRQLIEIRWDQGKVAVRFPATERRADREEVEIRPDRDAVGWPTGRFDSRDEDGEAPLVESKLVSHQGLDSARQSLLFSRIPSVQSGLLCDPVLFGRCYAEGPALRTASLTPSAYFSKFARNRPASFSAVAS